MGILLALQERLELTLSKFLVTEDLVSSHNAVSVMKRNGTESFLSSSFHDLFDEGEAFLFSL